MAEENQNIQVFVRSRPLNKGEKRSQLELAAEKRTIRYAPQNKVYSFDSVFDANAKQMDVYRSVVMPLVDQVIEGYNCTVFAYGQTGTGKTFTMVGNRTDLDVSWDEDPTSGMIPRAIDQLIDDLASQNTEYTIRVSFLELYNEDAYDLLSPLSDSNKLRIYNDAERKGSVIVSGLVEVPVTTKHEIFQILEKGSIKRQTAPTLMNACSSRSHSIFSITVNIKEVLMDGEEVFKIGKLNLVDLAGSENIGRSGAVEERAREASNINKSLLTLGRVITLLVEKSGHIPYRDSKLTRLLQDSLGGKTKTSIIATVSPGLDDLEDTLSTLEYAQRAKKITNKPEVNLRMSKKEAITEYVLEIDRLRRDLEAARDKKGVYVDAQNYASMEATLKAQEANLELREAQVMELQKEVAQWGELLSEATTNLSVKDEALGRLETQLAQLNDDLALTRHSLEATRTEVENQRVLVESHQRTEQLLTGQAKRILQVADKATDDNQRLFSKIDTLSGQEEHNRQHLEAFKRDLSEQMAHIEQMGVNIADTIEEGYQTSRVDAFSGELLTALQADNLLVVGGVERAQQSLAHLSAAIKQQVEEACLGAAAGRVAQSTALLRSLMSDSLQAKRRLEAKVMAEMSSWNEANRMYMATIRSLQETLQADYALKCAQLKETQEELARVKAVTSQIQTLMGTVHGSVTDIADRLEQQSAVAGQFTTALNFKADDLAKEIEANKTRVDAFYAALDDSSGEQFQLVLGRCTELEAIQGGLQQGLAASAEAVVAAAQQTTEAVAGELTEAVLKVAERSIASTAEQLTVVKGAVGELTASNGATAEALAALVAEGDQATLASYRSMKAHSSSYHTSQQHLISHCKELCSATDFRRYQASGMTPKKVEYEYPRVLVATSPHERILARHRENLRREQAIILENELCEGGEGNAASSSDSTSSEAGNADEQQQQPEQSENLPPTPPPLPCGDKLVADKEQQQQQQQPSSKLDEQTFIVSDNNNVCKGKDAAAIPNPKKHLDQPPKQQQKKKKHHGKVVGGGGGNSAAASAVNAGNRKLLKELN
ncbi:Kinesin- protein 11 [Tyrophagus putrescentiae]|nr:Kinesin- protein 11 [Tyrophagus putrescentiae]